MERRAVEAWVGDGLVDDFVDSDVAGGGDAGRGGDAAGGGDAEHAGARPAAGDDAAQGTEPSLSERERRILAFEHQWWRHAGAKEQAIRDAFDLSPTRYYQLLNALLEKPAALAHDPMLVKRLRRMRAARARARARGA